MQTLKKIVILRRTKFARISPFRAKSQFFANFALTHNFFSQILPWSAIFTQICGPCYESAKNCHENANIIFNKSANVKAINPQLVSPEAQQRQSVLYICLS